MKPFTIAIINSKGGVTKTTTAVSLSHLFGAEIGRTILLDLDPQASAAAWIANEVQQAREFPAAIKQIPENTPPARFARLIAEAGDGYEWLIIDTPPEAGDRAEAAIEAVAVNGGVVIIPTGTADLDLPRAVVTLEDIGDRATSFVLLAKTRAGTTKLREARTELTELGAVVLDTVVPLRESLASAPTLGLSEALVLYKPVAEELFEKVNQ